ncbi:MAG: hypothetical protein JSW34_02190 [Candidatus Zixiibacteriota bacterium]|nr:MAG: hypothetical protein JSW34_02190 [candidate division Zixibacteria bacterium]
MASEKIKARILLPLTIAIFGLLGTFVTGTYRVLNKNLDEEIGRYLASVKKYVQASHRRDIDAMSSELISLTRSGEVRRAWTDESDRDLCAVVKPYFDRMRLRSDISHCYVFDSTGAKILCAGEPDIAGEPTGRFTLAQAQRTGQMAFGVELCAHGTFSLKVVTPWVLEDRPAGFIEAGKELSGLTGAVPSLLGVQIATLVRKEYIDRPAWEANCRSSGIAVDWDRFADFVVVEKSLENVPTGTEEWLSRDRKAYVSARQEVKDDGRTFATAFIPLIDARARHVGDLVLFHDTTARVSRAHHLLFSITVMCILIGLALCVSFYKMLGNIERELAESRHKLIEESRARLEFEKRHTKELAAHVVQLELARQAAGRLAETIRNETENNPKDRRGSRRTD